RRKGRRGVADVDLLAVGVGQLDRRREGGAGFAVEEIDLARPGAGDHVTASVAVEVRQLRSEADASALGDAAGLAAGCEPGPFPEPGGTLLALVEVDAQPALVVLTDEQVRQPVAVEVADERGGVAASADVDGPAAGGDLDRGGQFRPLLLQRGGGEGHDTAD